MGANAALGDHERGRRFGSPAASAVDRAAPNCAGWLGTPPSGSARWNEADLDNQRCAAEGLRILQESPAVAAAKTANAEAGDGGFVGDPFRAPHRWAGKRGRYQKVTYTDRDGNTWPAARFGPRDAGGGPHPGVLFATVGGNSTSRTIDATDSFTATPTSPTSHGEFNPWHEQLDRSRLAIVGHSGAAGVALDVGNRDPRFAAIVAWDPAASASLTGVTPRIPTMIQVADYTLSQGPVPCHADRTARFTSVPGWPANRTRSRPIACCCVAGEPTISTTSARCS